MQRRHRIAALLSIVALSLAGQILPTAANAAPAYNMRNGPNYTERVVLTFDDCPQSLSAYRSVLRYAQRENIGLVLAPSGNCITGYVREYEVDIVRLARRHGQYVINHSISHRDLRQFDCAGAAAELRAPGVVTNFGRPPHGGLNAAVLCGYRRVGMQPWLWTGSTRDWTGLSRSEVVDSVVALGRKGGTILMHMQWRGFHPRALDRMKEGLEDKGLQVCRAYGGATGRITTSPALLPLRLPC